MVNTLRQLERVRRLGAGQQDREFVATETRTGVAGTNLGLGAPCHFLERLVTGKVTEAIVDLLEMIDVDHQAGQCLAAAFGTRQLFAQPIVEITPVVPAGQEIRDTAAQQARTVDRVFEADRHDHPKMREKIRGQVACESPWIEAAEGDDPDCAVVARQRDQGDAAPGQ